MESSFDFLEKIGSGSFGSVYLAIEKAHCYDGTDGNEVVVPQRKVGG